MTSSSGRILVIRGGGIGDFILTLPVLAALRRRFPGAHVELLGYPRVATLAKLGGLADEVRAMEGRDFAMLFARDTRPPGEMSRYLGQFTLVLSYLFDPDGIFERNVSGCGCAQFLAGPHRPGEAENHHATDVLLRPLERLAVFEADPVPMLAVPGAARRDGVTVALHPGSNSDSKNWPETNWRWLVELLLRETDWNVDLIAGEAEAGRLKRISPPPEGRIRWFERLPLPELAAHLANATVYAGQDSGISHLAAALGRGCVVLWSRSNEAIWRPRSERVRLLRSPSGPGGISVDAVFNALRDEIAAAGDLPKEAKENEKKDGQVGF